MKRNAINNYSGQTQTAPGKVEYMATLFVQTITKLMPSMDKESMSSQPLTKHYAKQEHRGYRERS